MKTLLKATHVVHVDVEAQLTKTEDPVAEGYSRCSCRFRWCRPSCAGRTPAGGWRGAWGCGERSRSPSRSVASREARPTLGTSSA